MSDSILLDGDRYTFSHDLRGDSAEQGTGAYWDHRVPTCTGCTKPLLSTLHESEAPLVALSPNRSAIVCEWCDAVYPVEE